MTARCCEPLNRTTTEVRLQEAEETIALLQELLTSEWMSTWALCHIGRAVIGFHYMEHKGKEQP